MTETKHHRRVNRQAQRRREDRRDKRLAIASMFVVFNYPMRDLDNKVMEAALVKRAFRMADKLIRKAK